MKRLAPAVLSALCLTGLTFASACGSSAPHNAPLPSAPADLLADIAGHLDTQTTFRLTMDTAVPQTIAKPAAASSPTDPTASPTPSTPAGPKALYTVNLSGLWSLPDHQGSMTGKLNGIASTVLVADGVEYISLTPPQGSKSWLKVDDGGLFGLFDDPRLVSQLLRAYHALDTPPASSKTADHITGTINTSEADTHIADPNLLGTLAALPDTVTFDITADPTGAPTRILFHLTGDSAKTSGTIELRDFGTKTAALVVPTADQVVEAPRSGG